MAIRMLRVPEASAVLGKKRSTLYSDVKRGLLPPPVQIGARASAWPDVELQAVVRARIAGKTEDEIRRIVAELVAARDSDGRAA